MVKIEEDNCDIYLIHPYRQHSLNCAKELQRKGFNFKYLTSNYYFESKFNKLLPSKIRGKMSKKRDQWLKESNIITIHPILYYMSRIIFYLNLRRFFNHINNIYLKIFSKKACKLIIKNKIRVVISYDRCSYYLYKYLEKKSYQCVKILDVTIIGVNQLIQNMNIVLDDEFKNEQKKEIGIDFPPACVKRYEDEYRKADYFLAGSDMVKRSLTPYVKELEKIKVINYGATIEADDKSGECKDPQNILFVGNVDYRKGTDLLYLVAKELRDYHFYVLGKFKKRTVLYRKLASLKNVSLEGFIEDKVVLRNFYLKSSVLLLPSRGEGLPLVVVDAINLGVVPICSSFSGASDIINNNGIIIPGIDAREYIKAIQTVKLQKFIPNRSNLSWERYGDQLADFLNSILGEQKDGTHIV